MGHAVRILAINGARLLGGRELFAGLWFNRFRASFP